MRRALLLVLLLIAASGCAPEVPPVRPCPPEHCIIVRTTIP